MTTTAITKEGSLTSPRQHHLVEGYLQGNYLYVYERATLFEKVVLDTMLGGRPTFDLSAKIRCNHVNKGEFPCAVPGWHTDLVNRLDHPDPEELHHIWVSGCPPIFQGPYVLEPEKIYSYDRVKHRATRAIVSGLRLFIRVSQSETIRLNNQCEGR